MPVQKNLETYWMHHIYKNNYEFCNRNMGNVDIDNRHL